MKLVEHKNMPGYKPTDSNDLSILEGLLLLQLSNAGTLSWPLKTSDTESYANVKTTVF